MPTCQSVNLSTQRCRASYSLPATVGVRPNRHVHPAPRRDALRRLAPRRDAHPGSPALALPAVGHGSGVPAAVLGAPHAETPPVARMPPRAPAGRAPSSLHTLQHLNASTQRLKSLRHTVRPSLASPLCALKRLSAPPAADTRCCRILHHQSGHWRCWC